MLTASLILAAAATGTASTVAIPVWLTILFGAGGPLAIIGGGFGAYMVYKGKVREIESKASGDAALRIDGKITRLHAKLEGQIDDMDERLKNQNKTIITLEGRIHRTEDYAEALRKHISLGNPPPPPPWPDFNGSHTSTENDPEK